MMTDPIADLLIRIRNGAARGLDTISMPASKVKKELLRVLKSEGFIQDFEPATQDGHPTFHVRLRYIAEGQPVITVLERISKPGCRRYIGYRDIKPTRGGMGLCILSTSKGIMTDQDSRHARLGGEVLCRVW